MDNIIIDESWCQRSHSIKCGGLECDLALLNQLTEIDFDEQDLFPMNTNTSLVDTLETINWNPNQSDSSIETETETETDTDTDTDSSDDSTQEQQSSSECETYQSHESSSSSNSSFSSQTTIPLTFPIFQPNDANDEISSFDSSQQIMTKLQQFAAIQRQHQKIIQKQSSSSLSLLPPQTNKFVSSSKTSPKRSRSKALKFPVKLMNALMNYSDETINGDSFKWLPDGKSFVVIDPDLFCSRVLKQVFPKECKYSSFIRKLHRWNFVKVPCGYGKDCFHHPLFVKDEYQLVTKIVSQPRHG